ncbi:MAG: FtsX-like permease family protein [Chloroflexi bacterium]|nr:FtsX-like permease family protein [Chloroflexota bacterium]
MVSAVQRFISAWQFVLKRSLAHWRLLSSVVLGVLLASTIMSGTVIYFDALREIALRSALAQYSDAEMHIIMQGQRGPVNREEALRVSRVVSNAVEQRLEWLIDGRVHAAKSPTMFLTATGQEAGAGDDNARTYFAYVPDIEEQIVIRGGAYPSASPVNAPGAPFAIEAMIPVEAAELFGARIGDRVSAVLPWSDDLTHIEVVISAIFQREDPEAEVWQLEEEGLEAATGDSFRTMPFHISEEAFLETLGPRLRRMEATYSWLLMTDADRVNARNSTDTLSDIRGTNSLLNSTLSSFRQTTSLDNALDEYDRRLFFSKLPMFVVLVLIAIVILYYVATLSSLVVEDRRNEVALLRSRGADSTQILLVFVMEGLTIAALSVVFGPLLAAVAISVLGLTPAFSDLGAGGLLTVSLSAGAYMMAALGGVLSFVALIIPAFRASRMSVTQERQRSSRPTDLPFFQRYYLDVLLLIIGILLFRQLTEQGSVVARNLFGEIAVNQMLLAVPGIILVASAMVLLRLFPVVMNLLSRLLSSWLPAGMVMGVWQMARNPAHYARLSLLLILTAGLGIFAASFSATLDRSFVERVLFFTGSDVRLNGNVPVSSFRRGLSPEDQFKSISILRERYEQIPGIDSVSLVRRSSGHDLSKIFGGTYDMVAVEPERFLDVAWFREDFTGRPVSEVFSSLKTDGGPVGLAIPPGSKHLGVQVKPDRPHSSVLMSARVGDSRGRYYTYRLGALGFASWEELSVDLTAVGGRGQPSTAPEEPLTLVSIVVQERRGDRQLQPGSVLIDEIRVTTEGGQSTVIETFDSVDDWGLLRTTETAIADVLRPSDVGFEDESGSALYSWAEGAAVSARGIFHGQLTPVPVVASKAFNKNSGHKIGDEFDVSVSGHRIPVRIVDEISFFPTMNLREKSYMVSDMNSLIRYASMGTVTSEVLPNELWLSSSSTGAEREALIERLNLSESFLIDSYQDRDAMLAESKVDPLVKAGWRSLLFIAFSSVLVLSCLGFLVHAYISFRNRQLQFALLRTVGFSMRQLVTMVWLEQMLVILAGLALGTWMGSRLGAVIMPFLGHDDFGSQVMPPFAIQINWSVLILTYAIMFIVFAVIILGMIWLVNRISLQRVLRLGEIG